MHNLFEFCLFLIITILILGKPISRIKEMYMRFKDQVFKGLRPYDSAPLETLLKQEFGEATVMSDIRYPKYVQTRNFSKSTR